MGQIVINAPDSPHRGPNTGDGPEFGDNYQTVILAMNAMCSELYNGAPLVGGSITNFKPQNLKFYRAALSKVRNKSGRARIAVVGASTINGQGTGTGGGGLTGGYATSPVADLAAILGSQLLGAQGTVPASFNSVYNDQNTGVAYGLYDVRCTLGANWGGLGVPGLAGALFRYTTGAANNFAFTPAGTGAPVASGYPVAKAITSGAGAGSLVFAGVSVGDKVLSVTDLSTDADVSSSFETTISIAGHLQQTVSTTSHQVLVVTQPQSGGGIIDTITVKWANSAALGSCAVNVDGGSSLGTISGLGAAGTIGTSTFTVPRGTHTINIVPNNNGDFYLIGIISYDSTQPAIDVIQCGWSGATASNFALSSPGNAWFGIGAIKDLAPDLTIFVSSANDSNNNTGVATYKANVQAFVNAALVSGDVILCTDPPSNTTQATDGTLDKYIAALTQISVAQNLPMLNLKTRYQSYAITNPILPYFDNLHLSASSAQDMALAIYEMLDGL